MTRDSDQDPQQPTPRYGPPPTPGPPPLGNQISNPANRYGVPPTTGEQSAAQQYGQPPQGPEGTQRYGKPETPPTTPASETSHQPPNQPPGQFPPGPPTGQFPQGQFPQGQAWGAGPGGPQYPMQSSYGQPAGKRNTGLIAGGIIGVIVLLGAGIFGITSLIGGSSPSGSPEEVVTTYLTALSEGDAKTALAQGKAEPATTDFVTDEILKKQQEIAKISDIKVIGSQTFGSNRGKVHVTYLFGEKLADVEYDVEGVDGDWKLSETTIAVDVDRIYGIPEPAMFGVPAGNNSKIYMFPGPVGYGSANKYFTVKDTDPKSFPLGTGMAAFTGGLSTTETTLTDAGVEAAHGALRTYMDECAKSTSARPQGCPQYATSSAIDGSVRWTAPTDYAAVELTYSSYSDNSLEVRVSGSAPWSVTYDTSSGPQSKSDTFSVYGNLDMSTDPPTFTAR